MITDQVLKFFSGKNVLVTGGTGLIGRQVVTLLLEAGANIKNVSLDRIEIHPKIEHVYGDLTEFSFCKEVTKQMDCVIHLAGIKGSIEVAVNKPASHFVPTLMFNTNVLEACRMNKILRVIYTSSIGAYASAEVFKEGENDEGPPMDFAGWAKRMAEFQIQAYKKQYGLNYSVVRPCNVYGPGDNFDPNNAMVIPSLMHKIFRQDNPVMIWGDGSAVRDFVFSRDVAQGIILALYHGTGDYPYLNLGSGQGCSIKELVETLHRFLDFNYEFDTSKSSGFPKRVMDISLAQKLIGYAPSTSLLEGLKETWQWFVNNEQEYLKKKNYFEE